MDELSEQQFWQRVIDHLGQRTPEQVERDIQLAIADMGRKFEYTDEQWAKDQGENGVYG
jgi:hypothetical protein